MKFSNVAVHGSPLQDPRGALLVEYSPEHHQWGKEPKKWEELSGSIQPREFGCYDYWRFGNRFFSQQGCGLCLTPSAIIVSGVCLSPAAAVAVWSSWFLPDKETETEQE